MKFLQLDEIETVIALAEGVRREEPGAIDRLRRYLLALLPDAQVELIALMWFGRDGTGPRGRGKFAEMVEYTGRRRYHVDYVVSKSLQLGTYLRNGLRLIDREQKRK